MGEKGENRQRKKACGKREDHIQAGNLLCQSRMNKIKCGSERSGENGKMVETDFKATCGSLATLTVKGLMLTMIIIWERGCILIG